MKKCPYIIINTATSIDGKIATSKREQTILSNDLDFKMVDKIRSEVDAILIGHTTLIQDNPRLTIKNKDYILRRISENKTPQPTKILISPNCKIPINSNFLQGDPSSKIIFTTNQADNIDIEKLSPVSSIFQHDNMRVDVQQLGEELYNAGIKKLLVEGGGEINFSFIQSGLVDEIRVAISNCIIGGKNAPSLADGEGFQIKDIKKFKLINVDVLEQIIIANYKKY